MADECPPLLAIFLQPGGYTVSVGRRQWSLLCRRCSGSSFTDYLRQCIVLLSEAARGTPCRIHHSYCSFSSAPLTSILHLASQVTVSNPVHSLPLYPPPRHSDGPSKSSGEYVKKGSIGGMRVGGGQWKSHDLIRAPRVPDTRSQGRSTTCSLPELAALPQVAKSEFFMEISSRRLDAIATRHLSAVWNHFNRKEAL